MEEAQLLYVTTPVAELGITATPRAVTSVFFRAQPPTAASGAREVTRGEAQRLLREAADQLEEYFAGLRRRFTLPLELRGTPFQRAVWEAVGRIPYGEVRSYARIAAEIGRPGACRAVGMANHRNPAVLLIPCHRVVGSDGSLTGYAGGVEAKRLLLELERNYKCDTEPEAASSNVSKETLF
ncbi:methylated-DNA--[protein]-cysteine S-methyltransferase [uncultured Alistipes sp.]|uniref:methylated-DNA--[protein]-cysteine S-methyltransferase n=1 Tax=uncultured Alistipes sp. TaxID=538949 RepID=UPI0025D96F69|nr:methylated-DNA--[protein]-cysteine S-methyltransferase [uncultured Alistipes sp.]